MNSRAGGADAAKAAAFPLLTGARGIAILWVVFAHLPLKEMPEWLERFQHRFGIGVDFFLAASGFLVVRSLIQCDETAGTGGRLAAAREFLIRRFARILPSYYALLGVIAALAVVDGGLRGRLIENLDILWSFPLFLSNYTMTGVMDRAPAILNMTWSLSYQEQFYAVLVLGYLLIAGRRRLGPLLLALGVLSALTRIATVLWVWDEGSHSAQLTMWTHLRFDAVAWATLAYIYYDRLAFLWVTPGRARAVNFGLAASLAAILLGHAYLPGDLNQALLYVAKAPVLALIVRGLARPGLEAKGGILSAALASGLLGMIGVAAYEVYLLNPLCQAIVLKVTQAMGLGTLPLVAGVYAGSVAGGVLMYRYFGRLAKYAIRSRLASRGGRTSLGGVTQGQALSR